MKRFRVTLEFSIDNGESHPASWDWVTLVDASPDDDLEVIEVSEITDGV